jgi:hypothetical protein
MRGFGPEAGAFAPLPQDAGVLYLSANSALRASDSVDRSVFYAPILGLQQVSERG